MANTYFWCDRCRRSYDEPHLQNDACPVCAEPVREMGRWKAIVRGLVANELVTSDIRLRHRQIIRMIWTRNGMGESYYRALQPDLPYNKFEAQVTELLCEGAHDGWVRFVIPSSPLAPEADYRMELDDDERFVAELARHFDQPPNPNRRQ